jgi:hypothetical protein
MVVRAQSINNNEATIEVGRKLHPIAKVAVECLDRGRAKVGDNPIRVAAATLAINNGLRDVQRWAVRAHRDDTILRDAAPIPMHRLLVPLNVVVRGVFLVVAVGNRTTEALINHLVPVMIRIW